MTTTNESRTSRFGESIERFSRTTESALHLQREMYDAWAEMWPGIDYQKLKEQPLAFRGDFGSTIHDLVRKQRDLLKQYGEGLDSLQVTFRDVMSGNAEEVRDGYRSLCLKTLGALKQTAEMQVRYLQETIDKMS